MSVTVNGEKVETLPVVVLVSDDEVDEVAAFYEKELSGWQHEEFFGTHMFWKGEAEENSMAVMASMTRPFVAVQEFDAESDPRGAGDGKTTITVAYVPEK